jgi:tripartite-type tricarboxylate transporter receptor subunit TctC
VATNTDVPPERVAALRRAFEATLADDDFRAEAARMGAEISLQRGEELQQLVTDIVNAPPTVLEKVRQAVR